MQQLPRVPLENDRPAPSPHEATPAAETWPSAMRERAERDWLCPLEREQERPLSDEELASYCVSCSLAMYCGR